jgi:hypothetical protein
MGNTNDEARSSSHSVQAPEPNVDRHRYDCDSRCRLGIVTEYASNGDVMFLEPGPSHTPACPKCQRDLRLHARLPQADGFPELRCLECTGCGEAIIVEQFVSVSVQQPHVA